MQEYSNESGHSTLMTVLLLLAGVLIGFYLRPVYETHYGQPSTEKIGAQMGRGIDRAIDKTGKAIDDAGDKLKEKAKEVKEKVQE